MTRPGFMMLLILVLALGSSAHLDAQGGESQKFTNLKVFPPGTSPEVLTAAMKNFTRALGVRCPYCHVGEEGMPLEKFDFASDAKPQKEVARGMMRLAAEINGRLAKAMPAASAESGTATRVTCWTCHRGATHPEQTPETAKPPGR